MTNFYVVARARGRRERKAPAFYVYATAAFRWSRRFAAATRFATVDEALAVIHVMREDGLRSELALVRVTFIPQEGRSWEFSRKPSAAPARKASASRQAGLPT